jgi:hypothetical protein
VFVLINVQAVNYLDIPQLLDLVGKFIANSIETMPSVRNRKPLNISSLPPELRILVYGHFDLHPGRIAQVSQAMNQTDQAMNQTDVAFEYKEWCTSHLLAFYSPEYPHMHKLFRTQRVSLAKNGVWYDKVDNYSKRKGDYRSSGPHMATWRPSKLQVVQLPVLECETVDELRPHPATDARFYTVVNKKNIPQYSHEWSLHDPMWPLQIFHRDVWKNTDEMSTFFAPMKACFFDNRFDDRKLSVLTGGSTVQEIFNSLEKAINERRSSDPVQHLNNAFNFINRFCEWQSRRELQESLPNRFEKHITEKDRQRMEKYSEEIVTELKKLKNIQESEKNEENSAREERIRSRDKRRKVTKSLQTCDL